METHNFVDFELAGCYLNLAWSKGDRNSLSHEVEHWQQQAKTVQDLYRSLLLGAFNCERNLQTTPPQSHTLLQEMGYDYITGRYSEDHQAKYPWWAEMIRVLDEIDQQQPELYQWYEELRQEKEKHSKQAELKKFERDAASGFPFVRLLWPLPSASKQSTYDANYDFPALQDLVENWGAQKIYSLVGATDALHQELRGDKQVAAIEICQYLLSLPAHQVITGRERSGKTWLRLYLENYTFNVGNTLPVFYFAPSFIAYQTNEVELITWLVRSIANQIFASLLERSGTRQTTGDRWRISRNGIIPFLQRYGYNIPTGDASLAQPIPDERLLNIDLAYRNNYLLRDLYEQMKEQIDSAAHLSSPPVPLTVTQRLRDAHAAFELAGYREIFLLIDNWDTIPELSYRRLLQQLLQVDLLQQLQKHRIFLKIFIPDIAIESFNHLANICEVERTYLATNYKLFIHTYRETLS